MTTPHLRDIVTAALSSLLGSYTYTNGQVTDAILVVAGNQEILPPEGTKVSGLEVVIFLPDINAKPLLIQHKVRETWVVHLKQWSVGIGVQQPLKAFLSADLGDFVVHEIVAVPADARAGIPAGSQIRLYKYEFSGE